MDHAVIRFRQAANRENRHRRSRWRYSPALQQQAIEYWQQRRANDGLQTIAGALGVAPATLQRWGHRAARSPRFQPVTVIEARPAADAPAVVLHITADGTRVDGLTVEDAARLLRLLR